MQNDGPAKWAKIEEPKERPGQIPLSHIWAPALEPTKDAELLLVDLAFANGDFVSQISNCDSARKPTSCMRRAGVPDELLKVFRRLKWCGDTINLEKFAAKTFQGFDCFGKGRFHENK